MPHDTFEEFLQAREAKQSLSVFETYENVFGTRPPVKLISMAAKYCKLDKLELFLRWRIEDQEPVTNWDEVAAKLFSNNFLW